MPDDAKILELVVQFKAQLDEAVKARTAIIEITEASEKEGQAAATAGEKATSALDDQIKAWRELKAAREAAITITDGSQSTGDGRPVNLTPAAGDFATATNASSLEREAAAYDLVGKKGNKTLAELEANAKQFAITTETEYLAVVKATEALRNRITVMAAAGRSTADLEAAQKRLSDALSTDRSLQIARNMESKAALSASLDKILTEEKLAATAAHTAAAQKNLADSTHLNTTSMREMTVIARELANGNFSRLPGSVSILASQFGLLEALLNPVTIGIAGAGAVFYLLFKHIEDGNARMAMMNQHWQDFTDIISGNDSIGAVNAALDEQGGKVQASADATYDLADASKQLAEETGKSNAAMAEAAKFADQELQAEQALALAKIKTAEALGQLTEAAARQRERDIKLQYSASANAQADKNEQAAIDALKTEQGTQQAIANQAQDDKTAGAGAVSAADSKASIAKNMWSQAQKAVQAQVKWLQEHQKDLSPDEFSKELAKLSQLGLKENQANDTFIAAAQAVANTKKRTEQVEQTLKAAEERVAELNKKITALETEHQALQAHREKLAGYAMQTAAQETATDTAKTSVSDFGRATKTATTLAAGGAVSNEDAQYLVILEQAITGKKQTLASATRLIQQQNTSQETVAKILQLHADKIATVQTTLDNLEARARSAH